MNAQAHRHEHELEPQYGLPELLPAHERILWQGSPDPAQLARSAFHLRKLVLYFGVLVLVQAGQSWHQGLDAQGMAWALLWPVALSLLALAGVGTLAWLSARTAVYTITNRRVVMRIGIVLTLTFNLPLQRLAGAQMRPLQAGHGDIALSLLGTDNIAWVHLWPHARPWHLRKTQPMLRSVPQAAEVARVLQQAWSAQTGLPLAGRPAHASDAATPSTPNSHWQPSLG